MLNQRAFLFLAGLPLVVPDHELLSQQQLKLDLDNRLTESEVIYGVRSFTKEHVNDFTWQVMRGRFGRPPWLEEGAGAGNRSQLARGGRKLGAAKVIA